MPSNHAHLPISILAGCNPTMSSQGTYSWTAYSTWRDACTNLVESPVRKVLILANRIENFADHRCSLELSTFPCYKMKDRNVTRCHVLPLPCEMPDYIILQFLDNTHEFRYELSIRSDIIILGRRKFLSRNTHCLCTKHSLCKWPKISHNGGSFSSVQYEYYVWNAGILEMRVLIFQR